MGAYKSHKAEVEKVELKNMGEDYALLEAGMEVFKAAKTPEGSIDPKKLEAISEKPEEHTKTFNNAVHKYLQKRLSIKDKDWNNRSEEDKSHLSAYQL